MVAIDKRLKNLVGYHSHREVSRNGDFTLGYVLVKAKGNYIVCEYSSDGDTLYCCSEVDKVLSFPSNIPISNDFFDKVKEMALMRETDGKEGWTKTPVYSSLKDFEYENPAMVYSFRTDKTERILNRTIEVEKDKNIIRCRCGNCGYYSFVTCTFTVYNGNKNGVIMDNVEIKEMKCIYCRSIVNGVIPVNC